MACAFLIARLDLLYPFFCNLELDHTTLHNVGTTMIQSSGRSRGGAQGARPPLFLDHSEVQRAEKMFFGDLPPPLPTHTLSQGRDPAMQRQ